jgi:transposase
LDEYKATGTQSWELAIRDEDGRLLFSLRLKKRDTKHIQVILRWLRLLGLQIKLFYVDFWLAYPPAIKAVYPDASIQYDFFHTIQNIHRHLYQALTAYRQAFKATQTPTEQMELHKALHKKLWQNRYLLFTNDENLSDEQRQLLDELLRVHADTIVEQMVLFRQQLRTIFNESDTYALALDNLALLLLDGWADLSTAFAKSLAFLQQHFSNICTYLRIQGVQRFSLSECTVRSLRRIESIRQGFKTQRGRSNHLKLLLWRTYLRPLS